MTAPPRVFVVEDEALIAMELIDRLAELGYEVCGHAARGEAALRLIPEARPDLILMDVNLGGGISGMEIAERLAGVVGAKIVFLTAYSSAELLGRSGASLPFDYLVKPFQPGELRSVVERALSR